MDATVLAVFALVYLGMILGGLPGLKLDRTGVALLGALALVAFERVSPGEAWRSVDVETIALLFGLMVVSAQFEFGGFYARLVERIASTPLSPPRLLLVVVLGSGALSAALTNDVICLALAPLVIAACARRALHPTPFLLALAASANVGSAATLIGNPQNILIGQALELDFARYLLDGGVPALLGLVATWAIVAWRYRGALERPRSASVAPAELEASFDRWQSAKGSLILVALIAIFLLDLWPRGEAALAAAALILVSRRLASRAVLSRVDWQLLVLFIGLFVVNHALQASGASARAIESLERRGIDLGEPGWLFAVAVVLSNVVSNVPAVMLLLPAASHELAGPILALGSTLAGNLLVVGSIANIIVIDQAERAGIAIGWREHARVGVPVTAVTLAIAALWLLGRAG